MPVGEAAADIDGGRESCRSGECLMGNLVTDAMLARVGDQGYTIAIHNGGGLRSSIGAGAVTVGDVLSVLPFQNTLATMRLSGTVIVASLEAVVNAVEEGAGKCPQAAGLTDTLDLTVPPDAGRVKIVQVLEGGACIPIDESKVYGDATRD